MASQLQNMSRQIVTNGRYISVPVVIDDMAGHVWSGSGLYFHFEESGNPGEAIPVMLLQSGLEVVIADVNAVFANGPQLNWKVTATDLSGNVVVGFLSEVTPNYDLGRYSLRLRK